MPSRRRSVVAVTARVLTAGLLVFGAVAGLAALLTALLAFAVALVPAWRVTRRSVAEGLRSE